MPNQKIRLRITGFERGVSLCILTMEEENGREVKANDFKFKQVAEALFNNVNNFQTKHWGESEEKDDGIIYKPGGHTSTIPSNFLTKKIVEKLEDFLVKAKTNDEALKIATAFNTLFKNPIIQRNFAALVGEDITADRLKKLQASAKEINDAIAVGDSDYEKSAIAAVISQMKDDQITPESIKCLGDIVGQKRIKGNKDIIKALFPKGTPVTAERLKGLADVSETIKHGFKNTFYRVDLAIIISKMDVAMITKDNISIINEILNGKNKISADSFPKKLTVEKLNAMYNATDIINSAIKDGVDEKIISAGINGLEDSQLNDNTTSNDFIAEIIEIAKQGKETIGQLIDKTNIAPYIDNFINKEILDYLKDNNEVIDVIENALSENKGKADGLVKAIVSLPVTEMRKDNIEKLVVMAGKENMYRLLEKLSAGTTKNTLVALTEEDNIDIIDKALAKVKNIDKDGVDRLINSLPLLKTLKKQDIDIAAIANNNIVNNEKSDEFVNALNAKEVIENILNAVGENKDYFVEILLGADQQKITDISNNWNGINKLILNEENEDVCAIIVKKISSQNSLDTSKLREIATKSNEYYANLQKNLFLKDLEGAIGIAGIETLLADNELVVGINEVLKQATEIDSGLHTSLAENELFNSNPISEIVRKLISDRLIEGKDVEIAEIKEILSSFDKIIESVGYSGLEILFDKDHSIDPERIKAISDVSDVISESLKNKTHEANLVLLKKIGSLSNEEIEETNKVKGICDSFKKAYVELIKISKEGLAAKLLGNIDLDTMIKISDEEVIKEINDRFTTKKSSEQANLIALNSISSLESIDKEAIVSLFSDVNEEFEKSSLIDRYGTENVKSLLANINLDELKILTNTTNKDLTKGLFKILNGIEDQDVLKAANDFILKSLKENKLITTEALSQVINQAQEKVAEKPLETANTDQESPQLNTKTETVSSDKIASLPEAVQPIFTNNAQYPKEFMKVAAVVSQHKPEVVENLKKFVKVEPEKAVFVNEFYKAVIKAEPTLAKEGVQDVCENMYEGKGITISSEHKDDPKFKEAQRECAIREVELRPDRVYSKPVFVFESTDVKINDDKVSPVTKDFILAGNSALFGGNGEIVFKDLPIEFPLNDLVNNIRLRGFQKVIEDFKPGKPYSSLKGSIEIYSSIDPRTKVENVYTEMLRNPLKNFFEISRSVSKEGIAEKNQVRP